MPTKTDTSTLSARESRSQTCLTLETGDPLGTLSSVFIQPQNNNDSDVRLSGKALSASERQSKRGSCDPKDHALYFSAPGGHRPQARQRWSLSTFSNNLPPVRPHKPASPKWVNRSSRADQATEAAGGAEEKQPTQLLSPPSAKESS